MTKLSKKMGRTYNSWMTRYIIYSINTRGRPSDVRLGFRDTDIVNREVSEYGGQIDLRQPRLFTDLVG
jgi:hypothetical protein